MTINHDYPYQHEWHLARPIDEFVSSKLKDASTRIVMIISVWVCQCGALKRHVIPRPKTLVYDPEGLQNHEDEMDEIELVDSIP